MAIKRWVANQDNTITNAYAANLLTRGVSGNMGQSDVLEVFSIFGQASSASSELERILIQFPVSQISSSRDAGTIPASGSVDFYLRMFNAKHSWTTPRDYTLDICPVSRSWCEGLGLDMENYSDLDASNWLYSCTGNTGSQACATITIENTDGGPVPGANDPFINLTIDAGAGPPPATYQFQGLHGPLWSPFSFRIGTTTTAIATDLANVINVSASDHFTASSNGSVVRICATGSGVYGNNYAAVGFPSVDADAAGYGRWVFATVTGAADTEYFC